MLTVLCWKWKKADGSELFSAIYVNRLRNMLERHLHLPHELACVTAEPEGIDPRVRIIPAPAQFDGTPRCRRRMWHFSRERAHELGERVLAVDLDFVILKDITPLIDRPEPVVCWRVGYANVYTGCFVLFDVGALHGAYEAYRRDPEGYPKATGEQFASETAMLTYFIRSTRMRVAEWTERDGLCMWFGDGYAKQEKHGVGPGQPVPPAGTRLVMFGSADKAILDEGRYEFVRNHWR